MPPADSYAQSSDYGYVQSADITMQMTHLAELPSAPGSQAPPLIASELVQVAVPMDAAAAAAAGAGSDRLPNSVGFTAAVDRCEAQARGQRASRMCHVLPPKAQV
jgi:hypothetical protein